MRRTAPRYELCAIIENPDCAIASAIWLEDINDNLEVTGYFSCFGGANRPFVWRDGEFIHAPDAGHRPPSARPALQAAAHDHRPREMQAANEGNSVVPGIGALYDDLTVVLCRYGDVDGDEVTGFEDLLAVLAAWGSCTACPEDLDVDGEVGLLDLLEVLANWSA
jgi:hypothetical protein